MNKYELAVEDVTEVDFMQEMVVAEVVVEVMGIKNQNQQRGDGHQKSKSATRQHKVCPMLTTIKNLGV